MNHERIEEYLAYYEKMEVADPSSGECYEAMRARLNELFNALGFEEREIITENLNCLPSNFD